MGKRKRKKERERECDVNAVYVGRKRCCGLNKAVETGSGKQHSEIPGTRHGIVYNSPCSLMLYISQFK